jgi:hypothetical protein
MPGNLVTQVYAISGALVMGICHSFTGHSPKLRAWLAGIHPSAFASFTFREIVDTEVLNLRSTPFFVGSTLLAVLLEFLPDWLRHCGADQNAILTNVVVIKLAVELAASRAEVPIVPPAHGRLPDFGARYVLWLALVLTLQSPGIDIPRGIGLRRDAWPVRHGTATPQIAGVRGIRPLLRVAAGTFLIQGVVSGLARRRYRPKRAAVRSMAGEYCNLCRLLACAPS